MLIHQNLTWFSMIWYGFKLLRMINCQRSGTKIIVILRKKIKIMSETVRTVRVRQRFCKYCTVLYCILYYVQCRRFFPVKSGRNVFLEAVYARGPACLSVYYPWFMPLFFCSVYFFRWLFPDWNGFLTRTGALLCCKK